MRLAYAREQSPTFCAVPIQLIVASVHHQAHGHEDHSCPRLPIGHIRDVAQGHSPPDLALSVNNNPHFVVVFAKPQPKAA